MRQKGNNIYLFVFIIAVAAAFFAGRNCRFSDSKPSNTQIEKKKDNDPSNTDNNKSGIDALTEEGRVVNYVKAHGALPDYYITKAEARKSGWVAAQGNLCEVLPGRAIGGDNFTNREMNLPVKAGRRYVEADLNYNCGKRNADRLVFSNDGLIFVTHDHYKTFVEK